MKSEKYTFSRSIEYLSSHETVQVKTYVTGAARVTQEWPKPEISKVHEFFLPQE